MVWVGGAHSLGIPLEREDVGKLNGFNHPNTKTFTQAFTKNKNEKKLLAVNRGKVELTAQGATYLKCRDAFPPSSPSNEDAARRIKPLSKKLELEETAVDILDVKADQRRGLSKKELVKKANTAPTTKSLSGILTFITKLNIRKKCGNV